MENPLYLSEENSELLIKIVRLLKKYQAYDAEGPLRLRRIGKNYDGGYCVPELALEQADIIMGYGISNDSSFEEEASAIYGKRSYGFDGSIALKTITHKLFHFSPMYLISQEDSEKFLVNHTNACSFQKHLEIFNLKEKKLFIKMDIEGHEYTTMPDILKYSSYITGITFEIHFDIEYSLMLKALNLLKRMQNDFILVHIHGHNGATRFSIPKAFSGEMPTLLELSYINKKLIQHAHLAKDQKHPTALDMPVQENQPEIYFEIDKNL